MKNLRPIIIIIAGLVVLVAGNFVYNNFFAKTEPASASPSHKASGWAWSDTIGWISFNCTDVNCTNTNYGVDVDFTTGNFSGYAWSDNIGWINFTPIGPYPAAPNYSAKYNSANDEVNGWIRAVVCETGGCGGGWDGWILLGNETNSWTNQVSINPATKEFEGWAWGSSVVGWVSFNCKGPDMCGD